MALITTPAAPIRSVLLLLPVICRSAGSVSLFFAGRASWATGGVPGASSPAAGRGIRRPSAAVFRSYRQSRSIADRKDFW